MLKYNLNLSQVSSDWNKLACGSFKKNWLDFQMHVLEKRGTLHLLLYQQSLYTLLPILYEFIKYCIKIKFLSYSQRHFKIYFKYLLLSSKRSQAQKKHLVKVFKSHLPSSILFHAPPLAKLSSLSKPPPLHSFSKAQNYWLLYLSPGPFPICFIFQRKFYAFSNKINQFVFGFLNFHPSNPFHPHLAMPT